MLCNRWFCDIFLHRPSKDIDIVVVGSGIELAERLAQKVGKKPNLRYSKTYGTAQVKTKDWEVEFVGARKESYSHESRNPVVKPVHSKMTRTARTSPLTLWHSVSIKTVSVNWLIPSTDCRTWRTLVIRTPLNPDITFSDDPLRMMRGIRFQHSHVLPPKTTRSMPSPATRKRINIITKERIADELNKIMLSPKPSVGFILLEKTGLLELIFPELLALKGAETKDGGA